MSRSPRTPRAAAAKDNVVGLYRPRKCAICGKPTVRQYHPFCSKRCADEDLGRWLTGRYAIPGAAAERPDDAPEDASDES
jgi:endogenous inhibitor of DNA gyrase (YacG/DUF329 family)